MSVNVICLNIKLTHDSSYQLIIYLFNMGSNYLGFIVTLLLMIQLGHTSCRGVPNPHPIIDADFRKIQVHLFGEKYVYTNSELDQSYYAIKVWGTSYQAGVAYGHLMRNEIKSLVSDLWAYYQSMIEEEFKFISKVPPKLQPMARVMAIKLLKKILLANYYITRPFTPSRFIDEYAGISVGSGLSIEQIIELNMIPEYTRAGCSILGAWGKATKNGNLIHLRALDWDVSNPINKYPTLIFYNLIQKGSKPFVNVGWAGFVGSLTGFGEFMGIGEKVRKQKPVKQNQTRLGKPWTNALRDVLQFSDTIDDAVNSLNKTKRTCSIYAGISSVKNNTFRLIEYSHKEFKVYDDKNFPYTAIHSQMDDVVFMPVTHEDGNDGCFNDLLKERYGNIDEQWMVNILAASHKTGDTQMAAYNFNTKILMFQVSMQKVFTFQRSNIRMNLAPFFDFSSKTQ